jgi:hypothetical protein
MYVRVCCVASFHRVMSYRRRGVHLGQLRGLRGDRYTRSAVRNASVRGGRQQSSSQQPYCLNARVRPELTNKHRSPSSTPSLFNTRESLANNHRCQCARRLHHHPTETPRLRRSRRRRQLCTTWKRPTHLEGDYQWTVRWPVRLHQACTMLGSLNREYIRPPRIKWWQTVITRGVLQ